MTNFSGDSGSAERVSRYFRARYSTHDQCGTFTLANPHSARTGYAAVFVALNDSKGLPTNASLAVEALHLSASECQVIDLGFDYSPYYSAPPKSPPTCHLVLGSDFGPVDHKYALSRLYGTPRLYMVTGDSPDTNPAGFYAKLAMFASKLRATETWNRTKVYVVASHMTGTANEKLGPGYESFTTFTVPMKNEPGTAKGHREEVVSTSLHESFKPRVFWEECSAFPANGRGTTPLTEGNEIVHVTPEVGGPLKAEKIAEIFASKGTLNVYIYRAGVPQLLGMGPHVWGASNLLWILTNHLRETEYFPFSAKLMNDLETAEALYSATYQAFSNADAFEIWRENRAQAAQEYPQVEELPLDVDAVQGIVWDHNIAVRMAIQFEAYTVAGYRSLELGNDPRYQWFELTSNPGISVQSRPLNTQKQEQQQQEVQEQVRERAEAAECTVIFGVYPGLVDYSRGPKDTRWTSCQALRSFVLMSREERSFRVNQMVPNIYNREDALPLTIRHMLLSGDEGDDSDHHLVLVYGQVPDTQRDEAIEDLLSRLSKYNPQVIVLETGALKYDERYERAPYSTATYCTDGKLYEQPIALSEHYLRAVATVPHGSGGETRPAKVQHGASEHEVADLTEKLAFTVHYEWGLPVTVLRVGYAQQYLYTLSGTFLTSNAVLQRLQELLPTPLFGTREKNNIEAMLLEQYKNLEEQMAQDPEAHDALLEARRAVLPWG